MTTEAPAVPPVMEQPAAEKPEEKKPLVREYRLKYTDDVKLPVKLTLTHLDSLEAGHPQRLPQFLMEALRGSLHLMEQDIVLQLPVES